jgi:DMSO/TMAO reductase YedYZ molybdopterin-dependent catalytic subunit
MKSGEHISDQSTAARVPEVARRLAATTRDAVPALAAGLVASLAATLVMLLLRLTLGSVTLPELVGERILPQLDAGTFVRLLIQFGKVAPLLETLIGQVVLGMLVAPIHPLLARRLAGKWPARAAWLAAAAVALTEWLVALLFFWPVLAENLSGFPVGAARGWTVVGLALIFAVYAAVLALTYQALVRTTGSAATVGGVDAPNPARRALLARSAVAAAGGMVLGGAGLGGLLSAVNARSNLAYEGMETPSPTEPITPANQFYVVSKNVLDPEVALANWDLEVAGLVRRPGRFNLPALRMLPMETRAITLECIANGVDGHLISTAIWRGVTLEALLAVRGGTLAGAAHVVFTGADGYASSLPLADLLAAGTLLACDMNGAPLPNKHGYPLRALVPGRFGEQSAKWLTRIELVAAPVKGFYQQQEWYSGPLYTISRIDAPGKHDRLPAGQPVRIHGIAFGGTHGIQLVEVSVDGGATWRPASFPPPLSPQAWALWHLDWTPTVPGATELIVRATDGAGARQIATARGTVPNGGTGLHHVPVMVVG